MIISVTNINSNENQEFNVNKVVCKAMEKLLEGAFTVVKCKHCLGVATTNKLPELLIYLAKYGYNF